MDDCLLDRYSDEQILAMALRHRAKFDDAWKVCMTTHFRSGRYIDAHDRMERAFLAMGQLRSYVYNNRPHTFYDRFLAELNYGTAPQR